MEMVSSDASDCRLQMNRKRLAAILLLCCVRLFIVSGARYEYDTSTIVDKYAGARRTQQLHHHHHQQHQQQQQQRTNDARMTTTDAGGGAGGAGGAGAGAGGGGGAGGAGGSCEDTRDLQSAVIRILNAHYEYDQAILVLHDTIEVLRNDVAKLRKKIDSVDHGTWDIERGSQSAPAFKSSFGKTSSAGVSPSPSVQGSSSIGAPVPVPVGDAAGIGVPLAFAPSPPSLTVRLDNLTFIVDRQNRRLGQLDKRLRRMKLASTAPASVGNPEGQRPLRHTPSDPAAVDGEKELERERERLREKEKGLEREREKQREKEKELEREREKHREAELERQRQREAEAERERQRQRREELMVSRCEREMEMTRELTRKQREINANVQRKMQLLEKMVEEKMQRVQGDAPYNQPPSTSQLRNGACPSGFVRHLSSCYLFENITANWIDAEKRCQALTHDAHLVSIDNDEEEEFLIKYRSYNNVRWSSRYSWIGANDMAIEGRWSWVASGTEIGYSNWRRGEPSNYRGEQHCAYLQTTDGGRTDAQRNSAAGGGGSESGRWDDWHCQSARINFVCEIVVR